MAESSGPESIDGASDLSSRKAHAMTKKQPQTVGAIFVHVGAGYHSAANEMVHLKVCSDAASMGMQVLRAGGTAIQAVEATIKVLEDAEVTNAGYGSNLTLEGIVECDATIVDHLGRSGACGATPHILNPIVLARTILEGSTHLLSLRRVPPNLLVGRGATDFAATHDLSIVPHRMLISPHSQERYSRWSQDLKLAESDHSSASDHCQSVESAELKQEDDLGLHQRQDHLNALRNATWNEGQPDSPGPCSPSTENREVFQYANTQSLPSQQNNLTITSGKRSSQRFRTQSQSDIHAKRVCVSSPKNDTHSLLMPSSGNPDNQKSSATTTTADVPVHASNRPGSSDGHTSPPIGHPAFSRQVPQDLHLGSLHSFEDEDLITDTVGAIAVDIYGNIAAGSSSGGIGMKHQGRVGPAALVGVGTAVIPMNEHSDEKVAVAAVTSGTGEHMATTMASYKCAERLYYNTRKGPKGVDVEATEEESMYYFVRDDFMGHPGVKASNCSGAIGVMAVKKTPYGYFFHFAHNTDSFALASMSTNEKAPKCVMSRLKDHGKIVQGGRKIRLN